MTKPPRKQHCAQFILRVWVGEDNRIHLNRNDLVRPYGRKTFSNPAALMRYMHSEQHGFGNDELFNAVYNMCSMGLVDPDLDERTKQEILEGIQNG